tara:strand:+ start:913 stop:1143 length:231 start_codon:yes stop_codon:yes gene_type:complete
MKKNKNKYYKVKETKNALGETEFLVFACDNWIEKFFGVWSEYTKQNETFEEALNHINTLVSWKIVKEKIVYKRKVK